MVILHITNLSNSKYNGMSIVIPQHVIEQGKSEKVALVNCCGIEFEQLKEQQLHFKDGCNIEELPEPFNHPDIVVFHGVYQMVMLKMAKYLVKNHIPYISVPHGGLTQASQNKGRLKKSIANLIYFNNFYKNASAIQFLSKREKENSIFSEKGFIGTNGITLQEKRREYDNDNNKEVLRFVYIGRYDLSHKGLNLLIPAFAKAYKNVKHIRFDMYGLGKDYEEKEIASFVKEQGLPSVISMGGPLYDSDKEKELLKTDVFIQTSISEGMPMGILEALSYGVPCMVTEGTNLRGFVEGYDAGWGCDTDFDEISRTIIRIYEERKELKEKGKNARKLIEENFSWNKVAMDAVEEYRGIIKKYLK